MINIIFGMFAGIATALGIGGGTLLILLLNLFYNLNQQLIQGINLIFFIPTSIMASFMNFKNGLINLKISKKLILSGIIGVIIGAFLATVINSKKLKRYFGAFLILIAINGTFAFFSQYKKDKKSKNNLRK
jgi:hypothetical protein